MPVSEEIVFARITYFQPDLYALYFCQENIDSSKSIRLFRYYFLLKIPNLTLSAFLQLSFFKFFEKNSCVICVLKFICYEKATKFCKIFTLLLTVCAVVKSKVKISQTFVAFPEYMKFN